MTSPSPENRPRRRRVWLVVAGFFIGVFVVCALLLAPPVQGWLLRRFVASQSAWRLDFERIGAGPTGVDARGFKFDMPGLSATSEPIAIRVSPTRLVSHRELSIERVEARKIRIVLTPADFGGPAPADTAKPAASGVDSALSRKESPARPAVAPALAAAPFDGVLRLIQVPLPWALDTAQLDGEIVVRDNAESRLKGNFALRGGGLSAESPGEFRYDLAIDSMLLPPGPSHQLTSTGAIHITQTPDHGIARIAIEGDLNLPHYGKLVLPVGRLSFELNATPTGESYRGHLALGTAVTLDAEATLNAATSMLDGRLTLHADQSAAASLMGERLPTAKVNGTLTFNLNLGTGDLTAAIAGDLDARDWQKIMPQLAAIDALQGRLLAAISRQGDDLKIEKFSTTLHGEKTAATATFAITHPIDPRKISGPLAQIELSHWPVEWGNAFLADSGLSLGAGEMSAAWDVEWVSSVLRLKSSQPARITSLALSGGTLPKWPALHIEFSPEITASATRQALTLSGIVASSSAGDGFTAHMAFANDVAKNEQSASGSLSANLPTLFPGADGKSAYAFSSDWEATMVGTHAHIGALEFKVVGSDAANPYLSLALQRPFDLDLEHLTALAVANPNGASPEVVRLRFANFPLAGFSKLSGQDISGTLKSGESVLKTNADGTFVLYTTAPWQIARDSVGTELPLGFSKFSALISPSATFRADHISAAIEDIAISTATNNRFTGQFSATLTPSKKELTADIALDADLPSLPNSGRTFGPISASLRAKFHNMNLRIMGADAFDLSVKNKSRELFSVRAVQPFIFGLSDANMVVVSTLAPLRIKTGALPLAWLNEVERVVPNALSGSVDVSTRTDSLSALGTTRSTFEGTIAPAEFTLAASVSKYSLRAVVPVCVEKLSMQQGAKEITRDTVLTFDPGLDLTFIAVTKPKFEMAYVGTAHLTEARAEIAGKRVADIDLALGFKGNGALTLPDQIDLSSRVDFAALPNATALGLPSRGTLVARLNGDLLAAEPVELWARLSGVPEREEKESDSVKAPAASVVAAKTSPANGVGGAQGGRILPSLEVTVRGKLSKEDVFAGGVEVLLDPADEAARPADPKSSLVSRSLSLPSDFKFDMKMNLHEGGLNITSAVHSRFVDGAALLALARAFPPPPKSTASPIAPRASPATASPAKSAAQPAGVAKAQSESSATRPFWGELTGSFDLDLGSVQFAPYRIDHVRGRLDASRSMLSLHDLGGEMFAGKWSGRLTIEHDPQNRTGEHVLAGEFHIEQFESARVVQTVFPNQLASVDARVNVNAKVDSHGNSFIALIDQSVASFEVNGDNGVMRLTVPKGDLLSTAAVFGGTVLLSPELRALGRLLKKFSEMPFEELRIKGRRDANGEVSLDEFRFESAQARLVGSGRVASDAKEPLMNRPLDLKMQLAAKDELAVILGGMSLLEKKPQPDGFRSMRQPFEIGGRAGAPDTAPLYDLLATAVSGSKGTWGFLMRKVGKEIEKTKAPATAAAAKPGA